jgi:hypothetical protein
MLQPTTIPAGAHQAILQERRPISPHHHTARVLCTLFRVHEFRYTKLEKAAPAALLHLLSPAIGQCSSLVGKLRGVEIQHSAQPC